MSKATTLSFRAKSHFIEKMTSGSKILRQNRSGYIKQAVSERNERILAKRVAFLSKKLSAQSLAVCEEMDAITGDRHVLA